MKKRINLILILIVFMIFSFKLFTIYKNKDVYTEKLKQKVSVMVYGVSAPRGRILDRSGKVLVDNKGIKTIYYNKIRGISVEKELNIAKKIASIITVDNASDAELKKYYLVTHNNGKSLITNLEYQKFNERKLTNEDLNNLKNERITKEMINYSEEEKKIAHIYALMNNGLVYSKKEIKKNVTEKEYAKVLESNIPGVTGEISWKRIYPYNDTLKTIFGTIGLIPKEKKKEYLGKGHELTDIVGLSYLEYQYDEYLSGKKAKYMVQNDYSLKKISEEEKGADLVLSIDIDIQKNVDRIIKEKLMEAKKYPNTEYYNESYALISDPLSGEIVAISGVRINNDKSFSDVAINTINKSFTIGSAVKGATISVGYKYGLIKPGEEMVDKCIKLDNVPQKCSFKILGKINDLKALAKSSNFYQFMIAIRLTGNEYYPNIKLNATKEDFDKYRNMLASFGLGAKTEIDLPNESIGIIGKTVADDLLLNLSIGQYDTYTPVEVLQYINSTASGNRLKLSLMKEIKNKDEVVKRNEKKVLNKVDLEPVYLERIKEGMRLVLSEGTGKSYVPQGLGFAGKTGTSESFLDTNNDLTIDTATITSTFTGFYPSDNPKYSIVVIAPNVTHHNGKVNYSYGGARKITKDIVNYLENPS